MYSEQGLLARIGPSAGQVCQALIVSWNCTPGSAQAQAAWPICSQSARAFTVFATLPSVRRTSAQSASSRTACRKASVTRTELFEFCPDTVR